LLGAVALLIGCEGRSGDDVLTEVLAEPANSAASAVLDLDTGDGNLGIDRLTGGEQLLVGGTLQYLEAQGPPSRTLTAFLDQATLALKAGDGGRTGIRLPWAACNGATEWLIHLNPAVAYDITAHSNGGNVKLNLAGTTLTRVAADTGGGNVDVILPEGAADLDVAAKTGAGNATVEIGSETTGHNTVEASSGAGDVLVSVPDGLAARIQVNGGLGGGTIDAQFTKIDDHTYQSSGYDAAADRVEIMVHNGVGSVSVNTR
jgi:hypothetical protein